MLPCSSIGSNYPEAFIILLPAPRLNNGRMCCHQFPVNAWILQVETAWKVVAEADSSLTSLVFWSSALNSWDNYVDLTNGRNDNGIDCSPSQTRKAAMLGKWQSWLLFASLSRGFCKLTWNRLGTPGKLFPGTRMHAEIPFSLPVRETSTIWLELTQPHRTGEALRKRAASTHYSLMGRDF